MKKKSFFFENDLDDIFDDELLELYSFEEFYKDSKNSKRKKKIKKERKPNPFRLAAKKLFLTYSQMNISREEALDQFTRLLEHNIKYYVICQEDQKEKDGKKGKHLYIYLELNKKINITSPTRLDLFDQISEQMIHGSYQSVKNKTSILSYLMKKDKNYLSNLEEEKKQFS